MVCSDLGDVYRTEKSNYADFLSSSHSLRHDPDNGTYELPESPHETNFSLISEWWRPHELFSLELVLISNNVNCPYCDRRAQGPERETLETSWAVLTPPSDPYHHDQQSQGPSLGGFLP